MKGEKLSMRNLYKLRGSTLVRNMQDEAMSNMDKKEWKVLTKRKLTFAEIIKLKSI